MTAAPCEVCIHSGYTPDHFTDRAYSRTLARVAAICARCQYDEEVLPSRVVDHPPASAPGPAQVGSSR